jgi:transposase
MLSLPASVRIWLVAGFTVMRRRIDGLAALVQTALSSNPFSGELFIFRGRRSDRVKLLWHDADGMCLFYKRLYRGRFVWTHASSGVVQLSAAQLTRLPEGIDWRRVDYRVLSATRRLRAKWLVVRDVIDKSRYGQGHL